jgi:hypothetical protein
MFLWGIDAEAEFSEGIRMEGILDLLVGSYLVNPLKSDYEIEDVASEYIDLANETGGKVVTDFDKLTLLTDYIINRNDSLPRVEEESSEESPTLNIISSSYYADTIAISYSTNGTGVVVVLNDYIVGITAEKEIPISNLDRRIENEILLAPIDDGLRGDAVRIIIQPDGLGGVAIPNAPNTGGHQFELRW